MFTALRKICSFHLIFSMLYSFLFKNFQQLPNPIFEQNGNSHSVGENIFPHLRIPTEFEDFYIYSSYKAICILSRIETVHFYFCGRNYLHYLYSKLV